MKNPAIRSGLLMIISGLMLTIACTTQEDEHLKSNNQKDFTLYSTSVEDTFHISVQLPLGYSDTSRQSYPVVYLLDANFFFPMLAPILHQYEKAGLLSPLILVGIGYASWEAMDTLRQRDYLYPAALPSDEMLTEGGGQDFARFIMDELVPEIDARYSTSTGHRTIAGHSFGGYFALYALLYQVETSKISFKNYIAASPSVWYHDFYLKRLPDQLHAQDDLDSLGIFLSVGSLEDTIWSVTPIKNLALDFEKKKIPKMRVDIDTYHFDHMEVALPSFVKGLRNFYHK